MSAQISNVVDTALLHYFEKKLIHIGDKVTIPFTYHMIYEGGQSFLDEQTNRTYFQALVAVLQEHPNWIVEISNHTDCRGAAAYNQEISQRRVNIIKKYLLRHNITEERVIAKGFGETMPINDCDCANRKKQCKEAELWANQRTEIKIVAIKS